MVQRTHVDARGTLAARTPRLAGAPVSSALVQRLTQGMTAWHITWGTYGARLHGGDRSTVDRPSARRGEPFVERDDRFEQFEKNRMRGHAVLLAQEQRRHVEAAIPRVCDRGGWTLHTCAAGPEGDHVHVLCDAGSSAEAKTIRKLLKRWVGQELDKRWPHPGGGTWWADGGSTKAVKDDTYLNRAFEYILVQRTTPSSEPGGPPPK